MSERLVDLDGLLVPAIDGDGEETLSTHLWHTNCDGLCVVQDGIVRYEWRPVGVPGAYQSAAVNPASRHLLMSVSKSLCATVLGSAVGRGEVALTDLVTDVAPEFRDSSVVGATVRHLIDMTAGTDFIEDYDSYRFPDSDIQVIDYERQASFRPLNGKSPIGVLAHFRTYGLAREHGAWFDYRSPLTNIVARVLECATGLDYASLLSRDLWGQIGAEHPAEIVVDHLGFPVAEAGISCSLRDLARVGLVYVNDGSIGDVQVVPEGWARDCFTIDAVAHEAFSTSPSKAGRNSAVWRPHAYRSAWWVVDSERVATALGIFGQFCWIHRTTRTVIVRFSSWPNPSSDDALDASLRAFDAIVRAL